MNKLTYDDLKAAVEETGNRLTSYAPTASFGRYCCGVRLEDHRELWDMAARIGQLELQIPAPQVDGIGHQLMAYWRTVDWEGAPDDEDDDD